MNLEKNLTKNIEDALDNERINHELKETLANANLTLKLYLKDDNTIDIERINANNISEMSEKNNTKGNKDAAQDTIDKKAVKYENVTDIALDKLKVDTKKSKIGKGVRVILRVGEELFDNSLRELFKKKYKWNYSVYNDAKSAAIATGNKDYKTAVKKATDSILYMVKNISPSTKKIIKNTKNVAIDEAF